VPGTGEITLFIYDAMGTLIADYSTQLSQEQNVNYITSDYLGSPRIKTDRYGAVISRNDYLPYGEDLYTAQRTQSLGYTSDDIRQKFTGYERDDESNLDYAKARYFNSVSGRYSTPDPAFFQFMMLIDPQRFDLYSYARNNPLKWTDPYGERLYLRGDDDWLRRNVLYEMAGGQEEFDKYFEIKDGQVVARDGVDISKANAGIQELAGLVNARENYVYFAGTDGGAVADLFQGTRDKKGKLNDDGKAISNRFTCGGNYVSGCGTQVGTAGRANSEQPARLANGDPVFAVIAYNINTVQTETKTDYGTLNPVPADVKAAQESGVGQAVHPVSWFIHESTENRKFAEQGAGKMDYGTAHAHAIQRETAIRKALNIGGGFAGAFLDTRIPKKK
jgi:RHS repeat-associated protein